MNDTEYILGVEAENPGEGRSGRVHKVQEVPDFKQCIAY